MDEYCFYQAFIRNVGVILTAPLVVDLPENLTIATAELLHQQLEPIVEKHQNVTLNAEHVSRVDTAGLQLLYAFINEQHQHQLEVEWQSVPAPLSDGATLLGLSEALSLTH